MLGTTSATAEMLGASEWERERDVVVVVDDDDEHLVQNLSQALSAVQKNLPLMPESAAAPWERNLFFFPPVIEEAMTFFYN